MGKTYQDKSEKYCAANKNTLADQTTKELQSKIKYRL